MAQLSRVKFANGIYISVQPGDPCDTDMACAPSSLGIPSAWRPFDKLDNNYCAYSTSAYTAHQNESADY